MFWIIYIAVVLAVSLIIGKHLKNFAEAYTEMTGMMAGMTMGMLSGFVLGYAGAAATNSMFWGNLIGILLGLSLGLFFGRPGGLMGIMDGAMGGVMGGSMGAMLAVMVVYPREGQTWTAMLLTAIWVAGMVGLVVLIERSAPEHEALHRLVPFFTRAIRVEVREEGEQGEDMGRPNHGHGKPSTVSTGQSGQAPARRLVDYYALLGVPANASQDSIANAYLEKLDSTGESEIDRLERALAVLSDPQRRQTYDLRLAENRAQVAFTANEIPAAPNGTGAVSQEDCCPPKKKNSNAVESLAAAAHSSGARGSTMKVQSATDTNRGAVDTLQGNRTGPLAGRPSGSGTAPGHAGHGSTQQAATTTAPQRSGQGKQAQRAKQGKRGGQSQRRRGSEQVRYAQSEPGARPVSWVGGVAALVILLAVGWWFITSLSGARANAGNGAAGGTAGSFVGSGGETQAQLEAQAVPAIVGTDGKQTLDVVLDSATFQYKPKAIKVKQGVPVHFNLSVENGDPG